MLPIRFFLDRTDQKLSISTFYFFVKSAQHIDCGYLQIIFTTLLSIGVIWHRFLFLLYVIKTQFSIFSQSVQKRSEIKTVESF